MSSSHHPPDRQARMRRAERLEKICQPWWDNSVLQPAYVVDAPAVLMPGDQPVPATVVPKNTQETAMDLTEDNVGVLIFGSCTKPGGGWRNGAKAQEEDVSLASSWALQAERAPPGFYNVTNSVGPDRILLAQGLWLMDPQGHALFTPSRAMFASVAAPNVRHPEVSSLPQDTRIDHLARRLAGCLLEWQRLKTPTVVLGAIGCGVFGWDGAQSATALRQAYNHVLASSPAPCPKIMLAMPDPMLAQIFTHVLRCAPSAPPPRIPTP